LQNERFAANVIKLVTESEKQGNEKKSIQSKKLFWMLFFCDLGMTSKRIGESAKKTIQKRRIMLFCSRSQ